MSNTVAEQLTTLQSIKMDIKSAITEKGGTVTDYFGGYAQAIKDLPSGDSYGKSIVEGTLSVLEDSSINSIRQYAFAYCSVLETVSVDECKNIGASAFEGCSKLTTISAPKCETIGTWAFQNCIKLSQIVFPECSSIAFRCINHCSNLSYISLGKISNVSDVCITNLANLHTISLANCNTLGASTFMSLNKLKSIYLLGYISNSSIPFSFANFESCFRHCHNDLKVYFVKSVYNYIISKYATSSVILKKDDGSTSTHYKDFISYV